MPEAETGETLESTWRKITQGRGQVQQPTRRQLKKSGTFKEHGVTVDVMLADENFFLQNRNVRKSETFKDRVNFKDRTNNYNESLMKFEKIRKEPSPSQDELNRRVEAFIQKFNEEMRLQRQESLKQYMEMIKRGADH